MDDLERMFIVLWAKVFLDTITFGALRSHRWETFLTSQPYLARPGEKYCTYRPVVNCVFLAGIWKKLNIVTFTTRSTTHVMRPRAWGGRIKWTIGWNGAQVQQEKQTHSTSEFKVQFFRSFPFITISVLSEFVCASEPFSILTFPWCVLSQTANQFFNRSGKCPRNEMARLFSPSVKIAFFPAEGVRLPNHFHTVLNFIGWLTEGKERSGTKAILQIFTLLKIRKGLWIHHPRFVFITKWGFPHFP